MHDSFATSKAVQTVLRQLASRAMYGLELLEGSGGQLQRWSLYATLGVMETAGLIESRYDRPRGGRRLYRAVPRGELPTARLLP